MEWQELMRDAIRAYHKEHGLIGPHFDKTPERIVRRYTEMVSELNKDPSDFLKIQFPCSPHAPMVHIAPIRINSFCAHHHMPVVGIAHFAYIPDGKIVGLSKIPRFVDSLSRRLHVQEDLCQDIVDTFDTHVSNKGCAVWMKAFHCCMSTRGAFEHEAVVSTTALRGAFFDDAEVRAELMANIDYKAAIIG